jgi:hypothetical protein
MQKLAEATFFLKKLESIETSAVEFDFFLSAFVSASRSVSWVLNAENKEDVRWRAWYNSREASDSEKQLLLLMNDLRVKSVKYEPLETQGSMEILIEPDMMNDDLLQTFQFGLGKRFKVAFIPEEEFAQNGIGGLELESVVVGKVVVEKVFRQFPDGSGDDVLDLCRRYLRILEALVSDAALVTQ